MRSISPTGTAAAIERIAARTTGLYFIFAVVGVYGMNSRSEDVVEFGYQLVISKLR